MSEDKDSAKQELKLKVALYQFYIDAYLKGTAVFLGITGALLKFAVDSVEYRRIFALAGLGGCILVLIPIVFGIRQERLLHNEFEELRRYTSIMISTAPFKMMCVVVTAFWLLVVVGWFYIYFGLRT